MKIENAILIVSIVVVMIFSIVITSIAYTMITHPTRNVHIVSHIVSNDARYVDAYAY